METPAALGKHSIGRFGAVEVHREDLAGLDFERAVPCLIRSVADAEQDEDLPHVSLACSTGMPGEGVEEVAFRGGRCALVEGRLLGP